MAFVFATCQDDRVNSTPSAVTAGSLFAASCVAAAVALSVTTHAEDNVSLADRVMRIGRDATWTRVASVRVAFRTFHPQGMVKIGERLYVSSVEVKVAPSRRTGPDGREERTPGEGVGHLFQIDANTGELLGGLVLGEGTVYHPGGIDFDGTHIWVPVAEYRPDSRSIVYRVDPRTLKATEVFRFADHLGAIVSDVERRALHAVSWGSRRFYRWPLDDTGAVIGAEAPHRGPNPSHYVDYQDCQRAGSGAMLCTGIADVTTGPGARFTLGGLELVNLDDDRPLHQVPVPLRTPSGAAMTRNPSWFETTPTGLHAYFMPEDEDSTIYVYEVRP